LSMTLDDYLAINVFHFMLVFARLSVVFLLMPGVSAAYVPTRIRLIFAVLVTVLVLPIVQQSLPPQPAQLADMAWLIFSEIVIGGFLGAVIQILMAALEFAGQIISTATGLANAMVDDPVSEEQSAIVIGLLNVTAVALIFITGLHHLMIMAMVDSYNLFVPNAPLFTRDMLTMAASLLDDAFYMGIRLAAPFLVFEMVFQIASGILARLSPQLNVFFVVLPAQIILGMSVMMIALPTLMLLFLRFFENNLHTLLNPVGLFVR
jgi:flagellar biosynthetic protein FliR